MKAIEKTFDYLVPERFAGAVRVGSVVRIDLHGRAVGGWVVELDPEEMAERALKPLRRVSGWGPPPDVLELALWAAWRWAGRPAHFLAFASPSRAAPHLPPVAKVEEVDPPEHADVARALAATTAVVRVPPAGDARGFVLGAAAHAGPRGSLVLCPSVARAARVGAALRRLGLPVALLPDDWAAARAGGGVVVGSMGAAWAPLPDVGAVVVLDAHDEAYQSESAPTWNAWQVVAERARRAGAPCLLVSPCPTLEQLQWGSLVVPSREDERAGWATVEIVDRRGDDPRSGLYSSRLVAAIRDRGRVLCVLNRKGRARLLSCAKCSEIVTCEACRALVTQEDDVLRCGRCGTTRPGVCDHCGSSSLKMLRVGVARAREELEALAGEPVAEVTGASEEMPSARVLVGTEALLHRVDRADVVAFLEFDQELLAPRYRAAEQALALLARGSRLVRGRAGRVLVQTRLPDHDVLRAAVHADPSLLSVAEDERRVALGFPPYRALAAVAGPGADEFATGVDPAIERLGGGDGEWLLRADDHGALCDALAAAPRPTARVRIEVDPARI